MDTRDFAERCRSCAGEVTDKNGRANFVSASTQSPKNFSRVRQVARFADDFALDRDQCIGGEHDVVRPAPRNFEPFAESIPRRQLAQGKIDIELFGAARSDDFKLESGFGQQLAATWRIGSEQQHFPKRLCRPAALAQSSSGFAGVA